MGAIDKRYVLKQGSNTLLERALKVGLGLGIFLILIRYFDKEHFGIWVLYMTFNSIVEISRIGLVKNGLIKYYIDRPEEKRKYLTASLLLNIVFSGVIVLLILVSRVPIINIWDSETLFNVLRLFTVIIVLDILYFNNYFLLQANFRFRDSMYLTFIKNGLFFFSALVVFVFPIQIDIEGFLFLQIGSILIAVLISFLFSRKYQEYGAISKAHFLTLWNYGKYVIGTSISSISLKNIDKLMLGGMVSVTMVAIYDTAMRISVVSEIPGTALGNIFFPMTAKHIQESSKPRIDKIYEESTGILLGFMIPIVVSVLLFADFFLIILGGKDYVEAADIMRLGILMVLFLPFNRQFGVTMDVIGLPKVNFNLNLVMSFINVGLNFLLILHFQIYGAIYATLLSSFISFVFIQIYMHNRYRVNSLRIFKYTFTFYRSLVFSAPKAFKKIYSRLH